MEKVVVYQIKQDDFKKLEKLAERIYNTVTVINYFCRTQQEIEEFNAILRPKIIDALKAAAKQDTGHAVGVREGDFIMVSLAVEADQKVGSILEDWKINTFQQMNVAHKHCEQYHDKLTLLGSVVPTLRHVLTKEDFADEELSSILVNLSSHTSSEVSSVAYDLCMNVLSSHLQRTTYITVLLKGIASTRDPETIFVIVALLYSVFKNETLVLSEQMLRDVEAVMLVCCASAYPTTRSLCYAILRQINLLLNDRGLLSIIQPQMSRIEKMVRTRILLYCMPNQPEDCPPPASKIRFEDCILSHYYDVWVFFVAEIMNVVIAFNYAPVLSRMRQCVEVYCDEMKKATSGHLDVCLLLMFLDVNFHLPTLQTLSKLELTNLYEEFPEDRPDNRKYVCNTIHEHLVSGNPHLVRTAFTVIRHLHFSLLPPIIDVLATLGHDQLEEATCMLSLIVRQPEWGKAFFRHNFTRIISFVTVMQFYFIKVALNGPRVMQWDHENEAHLHRHSAVARDYCIVVSLTFKAIRNKLSEDEWSLSSREVLFRFLINWAITKSPELERLRNYAKSALVVLTGAGHFFNDALLFDDVSVEFFGNLELRGMSVLANLLTFHLDVLLDTYIRACYTQPPFVADRYFEALIDVISLTNNTESIYMQCGQLLLLGMVFTVCEHPRAAILFSLLGKIIEEHNHDIEHADLTNISMIPQICSFATEAVFAAFFSLLDIKDLHVSMKDLIEAVRPWIKVLRLLPKQKSCAQGVIDCFAYYTPYQLLMNLMKAVETVGDEAFRSIGSLWVELCQSPDHREIVPLFVSRWTNVRMKERLFIMLLASDPSNLIQRLQVRCQFSFYFHLTKCLGHPWSGAKWIGTVMSYAFFRHWDSLSSQISSVIHFAVLFRDEHGAGLFETICKKMNVECTPEGVLPPDTKRDVVDQFLAKLSEEDHVIWGNEALKWVFGGTDIREACDSLLVYNRILKPLNEKVAKGVVQAASYVLTNSTEADQKLITQFVLETFVFFSKTLKANSNIAFKYAACFLDCRVFQDNSLKEAIPIFMDGLKNPAIFSQTFVNPISMIRPLAPYLETSKQAQFVVNKAISILQSEEIMMMVAPIKENFPHLFPDCPDVGTLLTMATETALCQALVHYSLLTSSASRQVLNSIFRISAIIVSRVVNENNRGALAKLYQSALRALSRCPSALSFIRILCEKEPKVATTTIFDVYQWERSFEDVVRSLNQIMDMDEPPVVTITDCHSFETVMGFRDIDTMPKILPFATNTDIINGMSKVVKETKKKQRSRRHSERNGLRGSGLVNSVSVVFTEAHRQEDGDFGPLAHPASLIIAPDVFLLKKERKRVTAQEFLTGNRRSSSGVLAFRTGHGSPH